MNRIALFDTETTAYGSLFSMDAIPATANSTTVSIVIVSYNSRNHLSGCLRSLEATIGPECEVTVLDNDSKDGSADYVAQQFPWVRLVRLAHNKGFAAATNIGVELSRGRYIVALNPDVEVTPGWLSALLAPFSQDAPGSQPVGATTSRILMMDSPDRVNTCGNHMHITGITTCRGIGLEGNDPELCVPCEVSAVSGACFAMPRQLWLQLGGLDVDFFTYLEDTDLSLRVRLAGYTCRYTPESVVYHSYTGSFSAQKLYHLERNRLLMLLKSLRLPTLVALLPPLALAEVVAWGYALKSGKLHISAKLQAYGWLLTHAEKIAAKRRATQRSRRVSDRELLHSVAWHLDMSQLAGPVLGGIAGALLNPLFHLWHRAFVALPTNSDFTNHPETCKCV